MDVAEGLRVLVAAGYGAGAGALLPRPAYRLSVEPGEAWRGRCPDGHPLRGRGGGWLGRARCGVCGTYGRSARAFSAGSALVCAALALVVGPRPELAVWLLGVPVALLLAAVDRAVNRLPDILTMPLAFGTAALLGVAALLPGAGGSWPRALLGGVVLSAAHGVLFLIQPNAMGFGDVKLALPLGLALGWYGWGALLTGAFLGFLSGAVYGTALVLRGRATRSSALAFGPFMVLGTLGGLLLAA
ncbi:A24 family peptidase [Streptomyces sp. DSM 42041]|uniref:A24 family peptidase n=1 Tax=Streptomyces hazeniae TaxID=3075538 RepID=A0ABU2NPF4_9ACTN|nr:A24 family peptidase [Streptomyces sp. DSM 42041]MDT0377897.1 A24 family peptidase [Streptomyces sp. DSM 42041]